MASEVIQPCKGRFLSCSVAGINLKDHLHCLRVYETITKPYLTGQAEVIDSVNLLLGKELKGEDFLATFDAGGGQKYDVKFKVYTCKGQAQAQSLNTITYKIELIGEEYFSNASQLVQHSFKHINGTSAIKILHNQYIGGGIRSLAESLGPISLESYVVSSVKPFKAIDDLAQRLNYAKYKTNSTIYFRDRDGMVLTPLEALFDQLSAQETYIQKNTWGVNWFDMLMTQNAIINAMANVSDFDGGIKNMAAASVQSRQGFDMRQKKQIINDLGSAIQAGKFAGNPVNLVGSLIKKTKLGGRSNFHLLDTTKLPVSTDPSNGSREEQYYQASFMDGPSVLVKVPIQGGLKATVGKGVSLKLIAPKGDLNNYTYGDNGGLMLVTDLCHEIYNSDVLVQATTTLQCVKGGRE